MPAEPLIMAKGLSKSYQLAGGQRRLVLSSIDLDVGAGETIALTGRSGSGKSTLLNILGTLDHFDSGQLVVCGVDVGKSSRARRAALLRQDIGFVFQFHHLLPDLSAAENVALPAVVAGKSWRDALAMAMTMLEQFELATLSRSRPGVLSGGERQRVAIARALICRPQCVLMDEPTGDLDTESAEIVVRLVSSLCAEFGTTFVIATHSPQVGTAMSRRLDLHMGAFAGV